MSVEGRYNQEVTNWNNSSTDGGEIRSWRDGSVLQVEDASPGVLLLLVEAISVKSGLGSGPEGLDLATSDMEACLGLLTTKLIPFKVQAGCPTVLGRGLSVIPKIPTTQKWAQMSNLCNGMSYKNQKEKVRMGAEGNSRYL